MDVKKLRDKLGITQKELSERTGIPKARISKWETRDSVPKLEDYKILQTFFNDKNVKYDTNSNDNWQGLPMFDIPVTAGAVSLIRDEVPMEPNFYLQIPSFRNCDFGARVSGDSMFPEIRNGDYVICKEVSSFIYGDIYLVVLRDGQETVKYIHPHPEDEDSIVLVPYNKSVPNTKAHKSEIIKIYKVRGVFKGY